MKRLLTVGIFLAAFLLVGGQAFAQSPNESGFGIGIGSSNMASGLSLKSAQGATAYQFVVGAWRGGWYSGARFGPNRDYRGYYGGLGASFDFLLEQPPIVSTEPFDLGWNAGLGAGLGIDPDGFWGLGGNGVVGLEFNFNPIPIDFTLEYRPALYIYDNGVGFDFIDFGAHLRFWL
ncbi:MAG: hypothetical protein ACQEVA_18475 [Myxococcota bacterium]